MNQLEQEFLCVAFLDWSNNGRWLGGYASKYNISREQASIMIGLGREVHENRVATMKLAQSILADDGILTEIPLFLGKRTEVYSGEIDTSNLKLGIISMVFNSANIKIFVSSYWDNLQNTVMVYYDFEWKHPRGQNGYDIHRIFDVETTRERIETIH